MLDRNKIESIRSGNTDHTHMEIYAVQSWDMVLGAGQDDGEDLTNLELVFAFIDVGHNPDELSVADVNTLKQHFIELSFLEG